jgi:DNA-binding protein H-NS
MSNPQIDSIENQIAELQAQKKKLLEKNRNEALANVRAIAAQYEFSAAELGFSGKAGRSSKNKDKVAGVKSKAPAKYANPANPLQTWAGYKGPKPLWVQAHLKSGGSLNDLLIK